MIALKYFNATHVAAAATSVGSAPRYDPGIDFGAGPRGMNLYASLVVGSGTRTVVSFQQSPDGTNWVSGRFYKWSGASTGPVATSVKLSGSFHAIFGEVVHLAPYNRFHVRSSGTKSTVATIQGWLY